MNGDMIFDSNTGFTLTEDEYGNVWSNVYGECCEEFHNEGGNSLGNIEEVY